MGPPTTATEVLPNGGHREALADKLLLRLHRTAARAEVVPAGPTGSFMRLLGTCVRSPVPPGVTTDTKAEEQHNCTSRRAEKENVGVPPEEGDTSVYLREVAAAELVVVAAALVQTRIDPQRFRSKERERRRERREESEDHRANESFHRTLCA